jgi:hypothetical protein
MAMERDKNFLLVVSVEGYSRLHNITPKETLALYRKYKVTDDIRACYDTLHTQSLDESVYFAEDVLAWKQK